MNRTNIEWVRNPDGSQGFTWNPITGCLNNENGLCKGGGFPCYAYKLANGRLKQRYLANHNLPFPIMGETSHSQALLDPFYPRFWEERLDELNPCAKTKLFTVGGGSKVQPKGIFVCDMGDLFGEGIPYKWTAMVLDVIKFNPNHRFYLLTKQPQNLIKFSPFPENCWVGVTATNEKQWVKAQIEFLNVKASVRYVSFEPLLERVEIKAANLTFGGTPYIHWLIIGACTGTYSEMIALRDRLNRAKPTVMAYRKQDTLQPNIEWVREIVEAADRAGIPVFLKNNLEPLIPQERPFRRFPGGLLGNLRQELPNMTLVRNKW